VATPPAPEEETTPPAPDLGLVAVLETGDPGEIAFVESLLMEAGIEYVKQGDRVQDLFGIGRLGAGFNVLTGPLRFLVAEENLAAARELIQAMPVARPVGPEAPELAEDAQPGAMPEVDEPST
jgi:hypothetical protein